MNKFKTKGIILGRTNFGEADRIITFLTPDHGKVRAIAKGVRKLKSKLAGGIELFSVSHLSILIGRGEINTLISTRLINHYGNIVKDLDRVHAAYDFMKLINKNTEDQPEAAYFELLDKALAGLDDLQLEPTLTQIWFNAHLLKLAGHAPNLKTDGQGRALEPKTKYSFDKAQMRFNPNARGSYNANDIKFLRLCFAAAGPQVLDKVINANQLAGRLDELLNSMLIRHART